jgi:predicted regulator of Ras-like GTPase activity (Roadblock/LC7/MglB family)
MHSNAQCDPSKTQKKETTMKTKYHILITLFLIVGVLVGITRLAWAQEPVQQGGEDTQDALGTAFTYQGQLKSGNGNLLTDTCDFQFTLWEDEVGETQVGDISLVRSVNVTKGLFTAKVNAGGEFGSSAFNGESRWLQIAVKCSQDGDYTTLTPRQELTAAPYAVYALNAGSVDWSGVTGAPDFQTRVSGVCAIGSTIRAINTNGTVVCQNDAPLSRVGGPLGNLQKTIDSIPSGDTGQYTSITIGADGLPIISYYDVTHQDLRVAHCEQADCSGTPTLTTVDSTDDVGKYSSIVIGVDGLPIISYYNASNHTLKVAHCVDVACSSAATITTLDNTASSNVGQYSSIAVGTDGLPIVSYYAQTATHNFLKVAHCTNTACTSAPVISTVDNTSVNVGLYTSIAISTYGLAAISYYDASNGDLKLATCSNFDCSSSSLHPVDSTNDVGQYSSLAIGNDGFPVISYYDATNQYLMAAHCSDTSCSAVTTHSVYSNSNSGLYSSITIGADGLPVISFNRSGSGLRVAHCADTACSSASSAAPISDALAGQYTAITIGVDGLPIISFYDGTPMALKTMHCASSLCLSYLRRR